VFQMERDHLVLLIRLHAKQRAGDFQGFHVAPGAGDQRRLHSGDGHFAVAGRGMKRGKRQADRGVVPLVIEAFVKQAVAFADISVELVQDKRRLLMLPQERPQNELGNSLVLQDAASLDDRNQEDHVITRHAALRGFVHAADYLGC